MKPRHPLLLAGVALLLAGPSGAQTDVGGFSDPARLDRLKAAFPDIDRTMGSFAERARVPGAAWAVMVDGKIVHVGTLGHRELVTKAPVDSTSVFRIASMSKSFAALSILKLRDAGKLSLDDPAERYVPELKNLKYPTTDSPRLTIRLLLTHSAGFPEDNPWGDQQLSVTDRQMGQMLESGIPFSTAPGTAYEYSNYGYAILGRIVANVSGMPYPRFLREQILDPLGMTVTTLDAADVSPARLVHGYRVQDGQWLEEPQLPDGAFGPMGGMLTSIGDLGRWVAFMLDAWPPRDGAERGPVRRSSVREMQQVGRFNGATAVRDSAGNVALSAGGYGYGLGVRQSCLFPAVVSHSGGLPGFGSQMRWLPDYGVGIIALGSRTYTPWGGPLEQALALLAGTGGLTPRAPAPAPVLLEMREAVSQLVATWDDGLADRIAATNLFLDDAKPRRQAAIATLTALAGGGCRNEGPLVVENALRGRWRMRCGTGDLRVAITLAPTLPARVQYLDVAPIRSDQSLAPLPACR